MTGTVEVARVRISPSLIDKICEAHPLDVRMTKIVASDSVLFKGKTFASVEVVASNFKGALTFIDCRFSGNVVLREVKASGPISFINCEFGGDFTMFGTAVAASISLIGNRITGRLSLDGTSTLKLDVQSISAAELSVVAHEVAARIECLSFDNISVSGSVRVDSITGLERLELNECGASILLIRHAGLQANSLICIQSSRIDEMILDDIKMDGIDVRISSTLGENIYLRNCVLERSKLVFEHVLANGLFAIKQCSYLDSTIDISAVTCPNLDIDESLLDFVASRAQKGSAIFAPSLSAESRLRTLKLLKDKFSREHRYDSEDNVFYLLKNFESRHRIRCRPRWKRPALYAAYFFNRCVMGWGVRLRNPLASAILMTGLCAVIYYITLDLHEAGKSVQYLGQTASGFYGATTFSLLAFFGQHADAKISGNVPIALALGEFILGVTMTTIIVGILIRKLVR